MRAEARHHVKAATVPAVIKAGESTVRVPEAPVAADASSGDNATARHAALLASPPYGQRSGHAQRARLVQQLQAGYGNHHVGHVIARMRQGGERTSPPAAAPRVLPAEPVVQRTAVGGA